MFAVAISAQERIARLAPGTEPCTQLTIPFALVILNGIFLSPVSSKLALPSVLNALLFQDSKDIWDVLRSIAQLPSDTIYRL